MADEARNTRSCGGCTLCCKVYDVPVLEKPRGRWCGHCAPGRGCEIHASRPEFCRDFQCLWILDTRLGDEWRPDRAKFVMSYLAEKGLLAVTCDPGAPRAWKREPYYSKLKAWAAELMARGHFVMVQSGDQGTLVTTETDTPLGIIGEGFELKAVSEGGRMNIEIKRNKAREKAA